MRNPCKDAPFPGCVETVTKGRKNTGYLFSLSETPIPAIRDTHHVAGVRILPRLSQALEVRLLCHPGSCHPAGSRRVAQENLTAKPFGDSRSVPQDGQGRFLHLWPNMYFLTDEPRIYPRGRRTWESCNHAMGYIEDSPPGRRIKS